MRLRMMQYKQYLQIDLKSSEKALNYHIDRQESLQIEFKEQEMQLWRWGLDHLLPDFRMQVCCIGVVSLILSIELDPTRSW